MCLRLSKSINLLQSNREDMENRGFSRKWYTPDGCSMSMWTYWKTTSKLPNKYQEVFLDIHLYPSHEYWIAHVYSCLGPHRVVGPLLHMRPWSWLGYKSWPNHYISGWLVMNHDELRKNWWFKLMRADNLSTTRGTSHAPARGSTLRGRPGSCEILELLELNGGF